MAGLTLLSAGCGSPGDRAGPEGAPATAASTAATSSTATSSTATSSTATRSSVTAATATSPARSAPGPCDVLSGAEVAAALGGSGAGGHRIQVHGCVYPSTGGPPRLLVSLVSGATGDALRNAGGFQREDGLGEWAGWRPGTKTLTVLDHDRILGLTYLGHDLDDAAARAALHGLARRAGDRW
jgi:hypothetical protein